jgi:hypothetical protein
MASTLDFLDRTSRHGPHSLWEAVGLRVYLQEQESIAVADGKTARLIYLAALAARLVDRPAQAARRVDLAAGAAQLVDLRAQQAVAWAFIRTFAEELIRRGEAPADMVERLRQSLRISHESALRLAPAPWQSDRMAA